MGLEEEDEQVVRGTCLQSLEKQAHLGHLEERETCQEMRSDRPQVARGNLEGTQSQVKDEGERGDG